MGTADVVSEGIGIGKGGAVMKPYWAVRRLSTGIERLSF